MTTGWNIFYANRPNPGKYQKWWNKPPHHPAAHRHHSHSAQNEGQAKKWLPFPSWETVGRSSVNAPCSALNKHTEAALLLPPTKVLRGGVLPC